MDTKVEISKLWKDVRESARDIAVLGLQSSQKVLSDAAAKLKKTADKLAHVDAKDDSGELAATPAPGTVAETPEAKTTGDK